MTEEETIINETAKALKAQLLEVPLNDRPQLMSDLLEAYKLLSLMEGVDHGVIVDRLDGIAYKTAELMNLNYKDDLN